MLDKLRAIDIYFSKPQSWINHAFWLYNYLFSFLAVTVISIFWFNRFSVPTMSISH